MNEDTMRIQVKRGGKTTGKKKPSFEVEKRDDGFYYISAVPSAKSSIKIGDRLIEINGVKDKDFKDAEKVKGLFDMLILDIVPNDESEEESEEEESEEEEGESEAEDLD
ncbi:MAG: hypothetical protein SGBAC_008466 [Bacillariaceae sp.]